MTNTSNKDRIDWSHAQIHAGKAFTVSLVDTNMALNATINIAFKTGSSEEIHLLVDMISKAGGHYEIIKAPTWTQGSGVAKALVNRNDFESIAKTSELKEDTTQATFTANSKVSTNVTGGAGGTVIYEEYAFGDKKAVGNQYRGEHELVLQEDTQYMIKYTADANTNAGQLIISWYED